MPYYTYNCPQCGKIYKEYRAPEQEQSRTHCDLCGGEYAEVTE